ncbi:polyhomeotic-like protein 1 [Camellia sinensis]|uniref:polyhomeotic-like protein 1 n=1 Tax=Camellia sinensis TaxID=4442 RepID=UPI001036C994|nr:polyhomeotic-like protein 1 [Camellia sinensis]
MRSWAEISTSALEREYIHVQSDQHFIVSLKDMMRQLQETMQAIQRDTARQAEVTPRQAEVVTQQAELIARLQQQQQPQQAGASAPHPPPLPPPPRVPILGETANVQENTNVPTGPVPPPIPPQMSKAPANPVDTPFKFEVDPTALKVSKLEKLCKRA